MRSKSGGPITIKRIDDLNSCLFEVRSVARDNDQSMSQRGCCDQTVFDRHRGSGRSKGREKLSPTKRRVGVPRQTENVLNGALEPVIEPGPALASGQKKDSETDFAEDDRIDGDLSLEMPQPANDALIRRRLCRLTEDVGVDEISHNSSVDSD